MKGAVIYARYSSEKQNDQTQPNSNNRIRLRFSFFAKLFIVNQAI